MKKLNFDLPQSGRLGRLAMILLEKAGPELAQKIMRDYAAFECGANLKQKAAWLRQMIERLEQDCSPELCKEVMQACGQKCCGITTRKKALELWKKSPSLQEFLAILNQHGIGGGRLALKDEHTVTGGYDQCFCGQVKQTETPFPTLTYCQCSTGWYKRLFETVLNKEVRVEVLQSIISGEKSCEFVIHI
jgi:predicted hydrocarbon binding protein